MVPLRVAIYSHPSLLIGSIAAQMARHPSVFEVQSFHPAQPGSFEALGRFAPAIVIVDALDASKGARTDTTTALLELLPEAKIVQVDCNLDQIQVFCSERYPTHRIADVMLALQPHLAAEPARVSV